MTDDRYGYVYRIYDNHDSLIYIGSTVTVPQRVHQHLGAHWSSSADPHALKARFARVEVEAFPTIEHAHRAEREAIYAEAPELNRRHNSKRWRYTHSGYVVTT